MFELLTATTRFARIIACGSIYEASQYPNLFCAVLSSASSLGLFLTLGVDQDLQAPFTVDGDQHLCLNLHLSLPRTRNHILELCGFRYLQLYPRVTAMDGKILAAD